MHRSIATIDAPEFINLQPLDINPMMSKCEIKVLYIGENRNYSYITKEVATEMAKTLRGAPIVGYYKEDKEDFADHGDRVIFDDEGIKFECMTKPYGFVSPDSEIWFQKFEDTDDFGNTIEREYLMATGYLWTGQYEEVQSVIDNGKNQSMELDESTMEGHWSTNQATGMDYFIIDDAMFSKLCILGDDVEPCFEGARVTKPQVSTSFSKVDDTFKKTLFNMMQELKFALKGGQSNMDLENKDAVLDEENKDKTKLEQAAEQDVPETQPASEVEESVEQSSEEPAEDVENSTEETPAESDFAKKDDEDKKSKCAKEDDKDDDDDKDSDKDDKDSDDDSDDDDEDKDKKYSKLEEDYKELEVKYSKLEEDYKSLVEFKNQIDNEKKDALISSFYMLSDEDKKDVVENKAKYSLDEIEAKLSVICVRKKVNFDLDDSSKNEEETEEDGKEATTTFSLNNGTSVPAWVSALRNTQKARNN